MELIIKTLFGLEELLVKELEGLGATNVKRLSRAVMCEGDLKMMYKINLESRLALRVLMPIDSFDVQDEQELYRKIKRINWQRHFTNDVTIAVDAFSSSDLFTHSKYIALKAKDAIVDQFREMTGMRQNVELVQPDIRVNVHIRSNICTVSLDSSGESLHKRGYRTANVMAPINEVLAAGMISLSEWDRDSDFIDPMCGSGTIAIEAAFYAYGIPPNGGKTYFAFKNWKNYDADIWDLVKEESQNSKNSFPHKIYASDVDDYALEKAAENIKNAGFEDVIQLDEIDFLEMKPKSDNGMVIINPPYDERLRDNHINDFYKEMSDILKQNFSGFEAWIISSNLEAVKYFGLRPSRRIALYNGALECKFLKYSLYSGTKKIHKLDENGEPLVKRKRMTVKKRPTSRNADAPFSRRVKITETENNSSFSDKRRDDYEDDDFQEEKKSIPLNERVMPKDRKRIALERKEREEKFSKEEPKSGGLSSRISKGEPSSEKIKENVEDADTEVTKPKSGLLSRISKKK